ncbi:MAG: hypothetical protein PHE89_03370 [Alphaproteobacteria bacterium]|nr:hypothetical protein [Alphaproteobacteria bacterium]
MLRHKKRNILITCLALLLCCSNAFAGLYGFDDVNPYTHEEDQKDRGFPPKTMINYRQKMRDNINFLSQYAKLQQPNFKIILHGDEDLFSRHALEDDVDEYNRIKGNFTPSLKEDSEEEEELLKNIQALSVSNIKCQGKKTPDIIQSGKLAPIYIEQCDYVEDINKTINFSIETGKPVYIFSNRESAFKNIKGELIIKENSRNVFDVKDARNISILVDDSAFKDKYQLLLDVENSNYDIVIMKPLFQGKVRYTKEEINRLKLKKNGAKRLIIAEMNLSEANPQDYFWKIDWELGNPSWLKRNSFVEEQSVIVEFWQPKWREILSHHFKSILDIGFDGVWFTGAENYQYFEKLTPLN